MSLSQGSPVWGLPVPCGMLAEPLVPTRCKRPAQGDSPSVSSCFWMAPADPGPWLRVTGFSENGAWAGLELSSVSASHSSQRPLGPPHSGRAARPRTMQPRCPAGAPPQAPPLQSPTPLGSECGPAGRGVTRVGHSARLEP